MCAIHWGKKSFYRLKSSEKDVELCRKCAVKYASKGSKVIPITQAPENEQKELADDDKTRFMERCIRKMEVDALLLKIKML